MPAEFRQILRSRPTTMSMVALFALSFDLLLITGLALGVLVVPRLRILGSVLSVWRGCRAVR